VAITFAMSIFSYYVIETPVRSHPLVAKYPRRTVIVTGLVLLVIFANVGRSMFKHKELFSLSSVVQNQQDWDPAKYEINNLKDADSPKIELHAENFHGGAKRTFTSNIPKHDETLYILGDSHALGYIALAKKWAAVAGQPVTLYSMPGCGDIINKAFDGNQANLDPFLAMNPACRDFLTSAIDEVYTLAHPNDTLFLAALKLPRFTEEWEKRDVVKAKALMASEQAQRVRAEAIPGNVERLKPLTEKGVRVVFEAPKPIFKDNPFRCADWFNEGNPLCEDGLEMNRAELLAYREPVMHSFEKITSQLDNTSVFDPFDALCPDTTCSAFDHGKPLFFDGDHLSAHGNMVVYDAFYAFLKGYPSVANQP